MFLCLCEMAAEEFVAKQINWYTIVNLLFIARFLQRIYIPTFTFDLGLNKICFTSYQIDIFLGTV